MTMQNCLTRLAAALRDADETFAELQLTMGDTPPAADVVAGDDAGDDDEPAFVDAMRMHATDVRGVLQETAPLLSRCDAQHAGDALALCQERCNELVRRMHAQLATPDNLIEVVAAGAQHGSWQRWSAIVQQALDRCADAVDRIAAALLDCWREAVASRTLGKEI
jgi:uncharacterized protein YukE